MPVTVPCKKSGYNQITRYQNIRNGDPIKVNFGGFVSLSTIDWRGKAVCTVFLRGCPLRCSYCQNEAIQTGEDYRELEEIVRDDKNLVAVHQRRCFFRGGADSPERSTDRSCEARKRDGPCGRHPDKRPVPGYPSALIENGLVDRIAIDYKTRWEGFSVQDTGTAPPRKITRRNVSRVDRNLQEMRYRTGKLPEFEVVVTVFYENEKYIKTDRGDDRGYVPSSSSRANTRSR